MLKIKDLKKSYGELEVLKNIDLTVSDNEIVGLVGPSGCGKTTALNIVSGLDVSYSGTIENTFKKTGCVFQEDRLLPWRTVMENIRIVNREITDAELSHLLDIMELTDFSQTYPNELSGGMKQRVSIARAFAYRSDLLLMDEPFKSLDGKLKDSLLRSLIKLYTETELSILIVTHDYAEAAVLCDRVVLLTARPASVIDVIDNPGGKLERLEDQDLLKYIMEKIKKRTEK
jgi:NitT/TauT family transport system ATP-binding protein